MSHPEVCESKYFIKVGGDWIFKVEKALSMHQSYASIALRDPPQNWRPIIAAVQCEEIRTLCESAANNHFLPHGMLEELSQFNSNVPNPLAMMNEWQQDWRDWGNQK